MWAPCDGFSFPSVWVSCWTDTLGVPMLVPGTAVFVDIKDDMSAMFDPCYPALEMLVLCCDLTLGFRCTCCLSVMC